MDMYLSSADSIADAGGGILDFWSAIEIGQAPDPLGDKTKWTKTNMLL